MVHSPESNFTVSAQSNIMYDKFEKLSFEIAGAYHRGQRKL